MSKIGIIAISHMHGDHYYGLMGIISTLHLYGRKKSLVLIGPPGLSEIICLQLKYSDTTLGFEIRFLEWKPNIEEQIFETSRITIETVPMDHRIPCSGFIFREKPKKRRLIKELLQNDLLPADLLDLKSGLDVLRLDGSVKYDHKFLTLPPAPPFSYAYCSDTKYMPSLAQKIKGVDILYHEATFANDMSDRAATTFHSTAEAAAQVARDGKVGRLLIGHFSSRYEDLDVLLQEARCIFPNTHLSIEGTEFTP